MTLKSMYIGFRHTGFIVAKECHFTYQKAELTGTKMYQTAHQIAGFTCALYSAEEYNIAHYTRKRDTLVCPEHF